MRTQHVCHLDDFQAQQNKWAFNHSVYDTLMLNWILWNNPEFEAPNHVCVFNETVQWSTVTFNQLELTVRVCLHTLTTSQLHFGVALAGNRKSYLASIIFCAQRLMKLSFNYTSGLLNRIILWFDKDFDSNWHEMSK